MGSKQELGGQGQVKGSRPEESPEESPEERWCVHPVCVWLSLHALHAACSLAALCCAKMLSVCSGRPPPLTSQQGGVELSFVVAVDFTASNGDPRDPSSLHYYSQRPTMYEGE